MGVENGPSHTPVVDFLESPCELRIPPCVAYIGTATPLVEEYSMRSANQTGLDFINQIYQQPEEDAPRLTNLPI